MKSARQVFFSFHRLPVFLLLGMILSIGSASAVECTDYQHHLRVLMPDQGIESATRIAGCGPWTVYADGQGSLHSIYLWGPTRTERYDDLDLGGMVQDLKAYSSYILATVSGVGLVIVSVGPTGGLTQVGILPFTSSVDQLGVDGYRAAVHLQYMVVAYIDWSDPTAPVELGRTLLSDFWPSAVAVRGTEVFVGGTDPDYQPALWRVSFSDPENPQTLNQSVVMPEPDDFEAQIMDIIPTTERVYLSYQRVIRYGPMDLEPRMVLITTPPNGVFTPGLCPALEVGPGDVANLLLWQDEVLLFGSALAVFNVQDPAAPVLQGQVNLPNAGVSGVMGDDRALVVCRDNSAWWVMMGDHTTASGTILYEDSLPINSLANIGDTIFGVAAAVDYPYSGWLELFALDASDPTTPVPIGRYVDDRPWPAVYTDLQAHQGHLFATGEGYLGVFDVSDPTAPQLAAEYGFGSDGPCLFLGDNLYLVGAPFHLDVYDAADPLQITPLADNVLDGVLGIGGYNDILIVSRNAADPVLEFYQVTDPLAPTLIASVAAEAYHRHLWIRGEFLFAQPYAGEVEVFSIADPTAPVSLSSIPIIGTVRNLRLEQDILYLAVRGEGMQVVDLDFPSGPWRLGGTPSSNSMISMAWVGEQPMYCEGSALMAAAPYCQITVAVEENPGLPAGLLVQAHPNPFNPRVNLRVELPTSGTARVDIVDVRGRRVRELFSGARAAGTLDLQWDGRNDRGKALPSGIYFVRLVGENAQSTAKITLLR